MSFRVSLAFGNLTERRSSPLPHQAKVPGHIPLGPDHPYSRFMSEHQRPLLCTHSPLGIHPFTSRPLARSPFKFLSPHLCVDAARNSKPMTRPNTSPTLPSGPSPPHTSTGTKGAVPCAGAGNICLLQAAPIGASEVLLWSPTGHSTPFLGLS